MKTSIYIFFSISTLAVSPIIAQAATTADPLTDKTGGDTPKMETLIPGPISDGKPGLPAPKPEAIEFEVERSLTKRVNVVESPEMPGLPAPEGVINVTVQLVKNPDLPEPPPPLPTLPPDDPAVLARMAELRKTYRATEFVYISATVYDHSRTLLRCYTNGKADREISVWSNLDFNCFSGFAIYQAKGADGEIRKFGLMMGLGNEDTRQRTQQSAKLNRIYETPEIPKLPDLANAGPAFVVIKGDTNDKESMAQIAGMHDLYRVEGLRMKEAYQARIKAEDQRRTYLLQNPSKPKDVTIRFWNRGNATSTNGQETPSEAGK